MNIWASLQHRKWMQKNNFERRKRWIRRFFYHLAEDWALVLWAVGVFGLSVGVWFLYATWPR